MARTDMDAKVVLITGAAKGMGAAHAKLLAERGAHVIITDVDDVGAELASEIGAAGGSAEFMRLDVTSEREWTCCIEEAVSPMGGLMHWSTTPE